MAANPNLTATFTTLFSYNKRGLMNKFKLSPARDKRVRTGDHTSKLKYVVITPAGQFFVMSTTDEERKK